jgi:hypothetical protein
MMPDPTPAAGALRAPPDRTTAEAGTDRPRRERAIVSCAVLGYWHDEHPEPTFRHRLGLRADLVYHDEASESPEIIVDFTATVALLVALHAVDPPGRWISADDAARAVRDGTQFPIPSPDPPASATWYLHTEPDGSFDLTTTEEPWYPVDAAGCDTVAG